MTHSTLATILNMRLIISARFEAILVLSRRAFGIRLDRTQHDVVVAV